MERRIEPEWLDQLPASDAGAIGARRDLRRVNALMGNVAILARVLRSAVPETPRRIADLGAGDGSVALALARRLAPVWHDVRLTLVDRAAAGISAATIRAIQDFGWSVETLAADVFDWCRTTEPCDIVTANLFLHHFRGDDLRRLFAELAPRIGILAACEPHRDPVALAGSRMLIFIGCNKITRHDAPASVWAGFAGREMSALWPDTAGWALTERRAGWASHLFVARRDPRIAGRAGG